MSGPVRLALLAARRTASPIVCGVIVVVFLLVRWREEAGALEVAAVVASGAAPPAAAAREALWTLAVLLLLPFLVFRSAQTFARWRAGELDFLAPRAASRSGLVASTLAGHTAAILVVALLVAAASELGRAPAAAVTDAGRIELARASWITHAEPLHATLPDLEADARLEIELLLGAGAGPAAEVVLRTRRGVETTETRSRVGTRDVVEVAPPAGSGPVELELVVVDPDARVLLPAGTLRVWRSAADERAASLVLALEFALLAASASTVALALGAFLAPSIASTGVLALWIVPFLVGLDGPWIPGHGLLDAVSIAGRGRVPASPELSAFATAILVACAAVLASSSSPGAWRRTR